MKIKIVIILCLICSLLCSCSEKYSEKVKKEKMTEIDEKKENLPEETELGKILEKSEAPSQEEAAEPSVEEPILSQAEIIPKKIIVIDPGHSSITNTAKEPIGPGSSQTKARSVSGTRGVRSGVMEYELNLQVSLKLRNELVQRGYEVILTRETNEVEISNIERTDIANNQAADAFIRIHADGAESTSAKGAMTICQTPGNPYNGSIYKECRNLSEAIITSLVKETEAKSRGVWETDTMTGINWSQVPVTIVEMGYMTNPEEENLLMSEGYQAKIVVGIANGIDQYFEAK